MMTSDISFLTSELGDQSLAMEKQDQSKELYSTTASFCPPALGEVPCGSCLLALVSCNYQKFPEYVELLCSLSIKHDYKRPSPQSCQFSETER